MEKKVVDAVISQLDFSIHDINATMFDAIRLVQTQYEHTNGNIKKRIILAVMSRLINQLKDEDELIHARVLLDGMPALIDMTVSLAKSKLFKRRRCPCFPLFKSY